MRNVKKYENLIFSFINYIFVIHVGDCVLPRVRPIFQKLSLPTFKNNIHFNVRKKKKILYHSI